MNNIIKWILRIFWYSSWFYKKQINKIENWFKIDKENLKKYFNNL